MIELVLMYLLVRGAVQAWQETKAAWGKSRKAYMSSAGRRYPGSSPGRRVAQAARHDLGYGLSQLLHGFPGARHGFAQGWNEGKKAHVQARTAREKARTEHAETHAGALAQWRELRERRREAQEEIRRQRQGSGEEVPPAGSTSPEPCGHAPERCLFPASCPCSCEDCLAAHASWVGRGPGEDPEDRPATYCGYCGTRGGEQCPPRCATWTRDNPYPGREDSPAYSYGPESATAGWPAATVEQAHSQARHLAGGRPWVVTEYPPGGGPGTTVAAYRDGEPVTGPEQEVLGEGSPSTEGSTSMPPVVLCGHCDAPADGPHDPDCPVRGLPSTGRRRPARPAPGQETPAGTPITKGTTSMSDVTYDGVVRDMATAVSAAETRAAEVNAAMAAAEAQAQEVTAAKTQAARTADQMQALRMDAATLGAMYDYLEALDRAEKAHQHVQEALEAARKESIRVMEAAQHVSATLARGHAGLAEAHQNAPVEAADREFYQD